MKSSYRSTFPKKHTFLAVVHVEGGTQALRNARIARDEGADGVFLINHEIAYPQLLECYQRVRRELPGFWIGLNCLDLGPAALEFVPHSTEGLWIDNAMIVEGAEEQVKAAEFEQLRTEIGWEGIYFGGVAFKYQKPVKNVAEVALLAKPYVDVVTTSGPGTGEAADIGKIRLMKAALGDHPLAIASGITPENVGEYKPYIDCFLVATGVSDSHTELNRAKVRALARQFE